MIQFLIIGAQKAGTSWLSVNLKQHPQIWSPFIKELHYFDVLHLDFSRSRQMEIFRKRIAQLQNPDSGDATPRQYYDQVLDTSRCFTDDWYRHIFSLAPAGRTKGECTPYYCALPPAGIEHILRLAPQVKVIYLVRDPIDRALSAMRMLSAARPGVSQATLLNPSFHARGDYRNNVPRWDTHMHRDNILYIPFGRIKAAPQQVLATIEQFLGLPAFAHYPHLHTRVYEAPAVPVEDDILTAIQGAAVSQYAFIEERFGQDFLREIK